MNAEIPAELVDLLTGGLLGHVATMAPSGRVAVHLMWIDYDGRHILTSSRVGSRKGRNWRRNPQAAVSVVDPRNPWRYLSVSGRVVDIQPDTDLAFIDRMAERYTGQAYGDRDMAREVFVIEPDRVRASLGR